MNARRTFLSVLFFALCLAPRPVLPDEASAALQHQFDTEKDAGRKVKTFRKLSDAQFEIIHKANAAREFNSVGFTMEKYRDNLRAALDALKHQYPNPDKHIGPYKDLEFFVSQHLHIIDDQILTMPEEYHPPLQLVRRDVAAMEDELLHDLFPSRPGEKPLPPAPDKPASDPSAPVQPVLDKPSDSGSRIFALETH